MSNKTKLALFFLVAVLLIAFCAVDGVNASSITSAAYGVIENAGSALPSRPTLNFTSGTCTDDPTNNRTNCPFGGGGLANVPIFVNASLIGDATELLFVAGSGTTIVGAAAGGQVQITISSTGGGSGGGVLGYSATALTLPTAGTTFLAPVGGALASTTEANVTANAPAAAAISNMYVSLSAAPGTGNTVAFTYRDAGSSTALTCTISGATATTCNDVNPAHAFTPTVGDALAVQVVTSGTVVVTPTVRIVAEYGVTGGGGGTTVTAAAPYIMIAGAPFVSWDMAAATIPTAPTYINSVTCSSAMTGPNGDLLIINTSAITCYGGYPATSSVEADFLTSSTSGTGSSGGIWIWDSANSNLYVFLAAVNEVVVQQFSYSGTGNPAFSSTLFTFSPFIVGQSHWKISLAGGNLTFATSPNGGNNFVSLAVVAGVGTISKAGFVFNQNNGSIDVYSLAVN